METTVHALVSCRNKGACYLNKVELQNGFLALVHANLFIPSTLAGTCIDSQTGKINQSKFEQNVKLALDVYINKVDGCRCGQTTIHLFKGAHYPVPQK